MACEQYKDGMPVGSYEQFSHRITDSPMPAYVLSIKVENETEVRTLIEKEMKLNDVFSFNGTVDLIVQGKDFALEMAKKVSETTNEQVGVVEYSGQKVEDLYRDMKGAIKLAKDKKVQVHLFNPETDSLEALLKKAQE